MDSSLLLALNRIGNIRALALMKLKFGKLSTIRLASSFNVVVEFGWSSVVLIGMDERCGETTGLSFLGGVESCSVSLKDLIGGT